VEDVKRSVELLHERGIALYLHQFNLLTFENGRENPITPMLLQTMLMGAAMERNHRHSKQMAGIKRARQNGAFPGRRQGATTKPETLLSKYTNVAQLIDQGELSIRAIAKTTNRSINTVRKVKALKG
jgi:DNA invertase Pin-like site-specific DNA recombinase